MFEAPLKIQNNFKSAIDHSTFNWEVCAIQFYVGNSFVYLTNGGGRNINIESREQPSKIFLWVVKMDNWVLGKDGKYHYEPRPSSRTDGFIENTRFETKEQALDALLFHERENMGKEIPQLTLTFEENR